MMDFLLNGAQLHLLVNHIAVIGLPIATCVLLYGVLRRSDAVAGVGLVLVVVAALGAGAAKWSGEGAEEVVEDFGVSEDLIHEHEEAADWAFIAAAILGVIAVVGLVLGRGGRSLPRPLVLAVAAGSLLVSGYLGYTAHLGGLINHPEIRDGTAAVAGGADQEQRRGEDRDHGEDDD